MSSDAVFGQKAVGEIRGDFIIPSYQRGYRWGESEVVKLLDDVYESAVAESAYCLQPVVVLNKAASEDGGAVLELIDGQQRLTTIYLIFSYLAKLNGSRSLDNFSLSYETREGSGDFLASFANASDKKLESSSKTNIDFHYMYHAYVAIKEWFERKTKERSDAAKIFEAHLQKEVMVIWYEVSGEEDPIALFTRLNIGKIPLTCAELVKALLLSSQAKASKGSSAALDESDLEKRQLEIAMQWDAIEKALHDERFWYFLSNESPSKYETRIELILDLIANNSSEKNEQYFTFNYFAKRANDQGDEQGKNGGELTGGALTKAWDEIYSTYLKLQGWYNDHEIYHKLGYILARKIKSLRNLVEMSKGKTKSGFITCLDEVIKGRLSDNLLKTKDDGSKMDPKKKGSYLSIEKLSYEDSTRAINDILVLFNVESVANCDGGSQRFAFDKLKSWKSKRDDWTLEHIHARSSKGLSSKAAKQSWIDEHLKSLNALPEESKPLSIRGNRQDGSSEDETNSFGSMTHDEFIKAVEEMVAEDRLFDENSFALMQEDMLRRLSGDEESGDDINTLGNLTLLSRSHNSALNNSAFDVKRRKIIEMDKSGEFIPMCTRNVFLKYYTDGDQQAFFWGKADRDGYINAITEMLKGYLSFTDTSDKS